MFRMRSAAITHRRARALRGSMTPPEVLLWVRSRARAEGQPIFRRQHPFGPYILDFYCAKARLAVEIDGQSHEMGGRPGHDVRREAFIAAQGVRLLRYRASEVMADPNGVGEAIMATAREAPSVIGPPAR